MNNYKGLNKAFSIFLIAIISFTANAQKLTATQQISMRAPDNIKIDGKTTEWNDKFQAYNKATDVFYTIANDDSKLYLIIKATDMSIINKIVQGGVTFTINSRGDRKDKNGVAITFPAREAKSGLLIRFVNKPKPSKDTAMYRMQTDSFMRVSNKKLADSLKVIRITGLKEIEDNYISVYNDIGIKATVLFDHKINCTYELAVPLKYLGLSINNKVKFSYQIKLNGVAPPNATFQTIPSGRFILVTVSNGEPVAIPNTGPYMGIAYSTDFWGEYTLAKK